MTEPVNPAENASAQEEAPAEDNTAQEATPSIPTGVDFIDNLEAYCDDCLHAVNDFFHAVARNLGLTLPSHTDHSQE